MSMMNSNFAMKSVLVMGAAAGMMMAAGGGSQGEEQRLHLYGDQ